MNMFKAFAICAAAICYAGPSFAAVNLGELSGDKLQSFSFAPGQVDMVYNFSLASAASFSVIQTDFTFGGALTSSLSLLKSTPDPTPPTSGPPTALSLSIEAIARIDAELSAAIQLLQTYVQNGDDVAAQIQQLRVSQIVARREQLLDVINQLLTSPPSGPLFHLSAASPSRVEGPGQFSDTLAAGDYSLRLSGAATGPGGGYLTFAVRPIASGAVPEPAAWALMLAGFGLTGAALRRRRAVVGIA